jgi:DNA-binding response OmpR family regulator
MPQGARFTVLLIEADTSLRRLIVLGLQRAGVQVVAVASLATLSEQPVADPDLLVLDVDNGCYDDASLLASVQEHPYLSTLPLVLLAWDPTQFAAVSASESFQQCLAKPFDARQLHATIEHLLQTSAEQEPSARRSAAASLLPSASLSPLATAAGLFLVVIGLMLHPVIVGLGLLVVFISLLWWTLGKRPARQIMLGEARYSGSVKV